MKTKVKRVLFFYFGVSVLAAIFIVGLALYSGETLLGAVILGLGVGWIILGLTSPLACDFMMRASRPLILDDDERR